MKKIISRLYFPFLFVFAISFFFACIKSKFHVNKSHVKYDVEFNSNGGSVVSTQQVESGKAPYKPEDPTRGDCKFLSWYKDEGLITPFDFSRGGKIMNDITFYARWECNPISKEILKKMLFQDGIEPSEIDVSELKDLSELFKDNSDFNKDLSSWDVSNVKNMKGMFEGAKSFNQDISSWDVSNVTNMGRMFSGATAFNKPLNNWDISRCKNMSFMFKDAPMFDQPLDRWSVSNIVAMYSMFSGAKNFNQDIGNWNTKNVKDMSGMFIGAEKFDQDISRWNVSNVERMYMMFFGATDFDQDLSSWDVSKVKTPKYIIFHPESKMENSHKKSLIAKSKSPKPMNWR